MIQTELQLGNYVYIINRNHEVHLPIEIPQRISKIGLFEVELRGLKVTDKVPITVSASDICPIPIDESILLRCGFKKDGLSIFKRRLNRNTCFYYPNTKWVHIMSGNGGEVKCFVENLHQLQNLIKLLTNETIELK